MTFCLSASFLEATTRGTLCLDMLGNIASPQVEDVKVRVRDKRRWWVYENRALKKIFTSEREKVKKKKMEFIA
jgi:hypothetical protein